MPVKTRFLRKVVKNPSYPDKCWGWKGSTDRHGYPQLRVGERPITTNRISWEVFKGPIPKGLCVLHKCDNPRCANPEHLFLGTKSDNSKDMVAKGRHEYPTWPEHSRSALIGRIDEIKQRRNNGESFRSIGRYMGVCHHTVKNVMNYHLRKKVAVVA